MPERILNKAKKIVLTPDEKADAFKQLKSFVQSHRFHKAPLVSWYGPLSFFTQKKFIPVIIAVILMLGGGTAFAASNALPGDTLYPVKIHVNENVQSLFAIGATARASVEASHATTRLEEAEALAAQERLSTTTQAELQARFDDSSRNVAMYVASLKEKGDAEAASTIDSDFESSLGAHEQVIVKFSKSAHNDEAKTALKNILVSVSDHLTSTMRERIDSEVVVATSSNTAEVEVAAHNKLKAALLKINEVKKYIDTNIADADAQSVADANTRIRAAQEIVLQGNAQLSAKSYGSAFMLFQKANREVQFAKIFFTTNVDIRVDNSGTNSEHASSTLYQSVTHAETQKTQDLKEETGVRSSTTATTTVKVDVEMSVNVNSSTTVAPPHSDTEIKASSNLNVQDALKSTLGI